MSNEEAPTYNDDELIATAELLEPYNPFDLFVEDESLVTIYAHLVRSISPTRARDFEPIPLSGRQAVVDKAIELEQDGERHRLFVIDGDAEFILQLPPPEASNLYRLNCYSIENILCSPGAMSQALSLCDGRKKKSHFLTHEHVEKTQHLLTVYILPLTIMLAMGHREQIGGATLSRKLAPLIAFNPGGVSLRKKQYSEVYKEIREALIAKMGLLSYRSDLRTLLSVAVEKSFGWQQIVAGKHTLAPIMGNLWRTLNGPQCSKEALCGILAPHCDYAGDANLKQEILLRLAA